MKYQSAKAAMIAAVISVAPAAYAAPQATEAQLTQANQEVFQCLIRETSELDDGSTDPKVISEAAVAVCREKRVAFLAMMAGNYRGRVNIADHLPGALERDKEAATYFILKSRASRK